MSDSEDETKKMSDGSSSAASSDSESDKSTQEANQTKSQSDDEEDPFGPVRDDSDSDNEQASNGKH